MLFIKNKIQGQLPSPGHLKSQHVPGSFVALEHGGGSHDCTEHTTGLGPQVQLKQ